MDAFQKGEVVGEDITFNASVSAFAKNLKKVIPQKRREAFLLCCLVTALISGLEEDRHNRLLRMLGIQSGPVARELFGVGSDVYLALPVDHHLTHH